MDFPTRLKAARKKRQMTQQALADKLDISRAAIAAYESGNRSPDLYIDVVKRW